MSELDDIYRGILEQGREAQKQFVAESLSLDAALYNGNLSEILSEQQDRLAAKLGIERRRGSGGSGNDNSEGDSREPPREPS